MNADQAKRIPIAEILSKLGYHPTKQSAHEQWFFSPFRDEKTPSFHVHVGKNVWYDFGEGKGGSIIDLAQLRLQRTNEDHTVSDALRWLKNMTGGANVTKLPLFKERESIEKQPTLTLLEKRGLESKILGEYLQSRGIPASIAGRYLKEVLIHNKNSGKNLLTLAFPNDDGGFELRNKYFKGSMAPKTISFVRGSRPTAKEINVFEGFMDFLSILAFKKRQQLDGDTIVLNSVSNVSHALPYLKGYGYKSLYSYVDADKAGFKAAEVLKEISRSEGMTFKPMYQLFAPFEDVNEWHKHRLGIKP